jgi:hypothetical protein
MLYQVIKKRVEYDKDFPRRAYELTVLKMVLDGSLYSVQPYQFHNEYQTGTGEYIPIIDRCPSIQCGIGIIRSVVEELVALTWGEDRFPAITVIDNDIDDMAMQELFQSITKESHLISLMRDATYKGSIGSVAIRMRILKERLFFDNIETIYLTPAFDPMEPDTLIKVTQKYKVKGQDLADAGYTIKQEALNAWHWFLLTWDTTDETWFIPWLCMEDSYDKPHVPVKDVKRSTSHHLGFVPIVWIKNLHANFSDIDGECHFEPAIETCIEIDKLLSQSGRGLMYSADPLLLIKENTDPEGKPLVRSSSTILSVGPQGDAKLLEITGQSTNAILEHVAKLREYALESIHGNRASPDKLSTAQSGRAMQLMHEGLLQVADGLRASYGEYGLITLMKMVVSASNKIPIKINGKSIPKLKQNMELSLRWSEFFTPTQLDLQQQAQYLVGMVQGGIMSRETAIKVLSSDFDIETVEDELKLILAGEVAQDAREAKLAAATQVTTKQN